VASPTTVASTVCSFEREAARCRVEARDLATGRVRWRAPTAFSGAFLGAPTTHGALYTRGPLWPSNHVVVIASPEGGEREPGPYPRDRVAFTVRELDTGRTVLRDALRPLESMVLVGDGLLRALPDGRDPPDTSMRLVDLGSRRARWRTTLELARPVQADGPGRWIEVEDGWVATTPESADEYLSLGLEDRLDLLDPRTGHRARVDLSDVPASIAAVRLLPRELTSVDARTAAAGVTPARELLLGTRGDEEYVVVAPPGAPMPAHALGPVSLGFDGAPATARLVSWTRSRSEDLVGAEHVGVEVRDIASGARVARYLGDDPSPRAVGERIVVRADDRDHVVAP
jgi:hypothetical protein